MPDYRAYAREAARRVGLDPDIFELQIQQESGFDPGAESPAGAVGIAQIVPAMHPNVDPRDPLASLDYAAQWMADLVRQYGGRHDLALAAYNAGPGNVAAFGGVPPFEETRRYLAAILGAGWEAQPTAGSPLPARLAFDPELPAEYQLLPWTCAIRAATWCLKSVGVAISAEALHDLLVPVVVNQEVGLRDASGAGIADALAQRWGLSVHNRAVVGWEDVVALAGTRPVAIGGRAWGPGGHWSPVRRVDGDGNLALANPSRGGYQGVGDVLSRADFERLGPFSAVWINLPEPPAAEPAWAAFRVANTGGDRLNLREQPSASAPILQTLAADTTLEAEGRAWRRVRAPDGQLGWVADDFVAPAQPAAGPAASLGRAPAARSAPPEPPARPTRARRRPTRRRQAG